MSTPGIEVSVRIAWRAYSTVVDGLVAHIAPEHDASFGRWVLTHAPSGLTLCYCEGPEQAQAIAAELIGFDWLALDSNDSSALGSMRASVYDAIEKHGGDRVSTPRIPEWSDA